VAAPTVAVVGAGIAGLTTSLALARQGIPVTVVERRTGFSEVGAGLQLSPNASRILLGLGLGPALRRIATEPQRVVIRSVRSGRILGEVALGPLMHELFGAPYWVVHRADLQTVLLDAVRAQPGIRLVVGRAVDSLHEGGADVTLGLSTASGARETLTADAVIGADGIWSSVRPLLGEVDEPRFQGYVAWRATVPRAEVPGEFAGNETGLWLGRDRHVVHYPLAGGRMVNLVAIERRSEPVEGWAAPGDRADLLSRFGGADGGLRSLLTNPDRWLLWSLFDRPAGRIAKGRVALAGDAAHPVLPFLAQGAALAVEDAAALAAALRESAPVKAFEAYEAQRSGRIRRVQQHARRNGRIYHLGGPMALARNLVMRRLGAQEMTRRYAWLYGAGAAA
jgi:salicylate hydroxylase